MASRKYKQNKRGEYEARIWDGTYNPDGTKHRRYLVSKKSSADLERQVADLKKQVEEQGNVSYSCVTFGEYKKQWLSISKSAREKKTIMMYDRILSRLSFLDDVQMTDIRYSHFQQAINNNINHPRTCQQIALTMKQMIKYAVKARILPRSAVDDITADVSLPTYQKASKRGLTPVEKAAVLSAKLDRKKAAFLAVLYYCGLRKGEALALTPSDFDWDKKTVSVTKTLIFVPHPEIKPYPKSKNGMRVIPIPGPAIEKIKPFADASNGGYLFHTQTGELMTATGYNCMWRSILVELNRAAGHDPLRDRLNEKPIQGLTAHILRHNYCTELCYQVPSVSTKMIARLMGDTEKMVLDVYSHIVEEKENVSETLEKTFG